MTHKRVYDIFKDKFPQLANETTEYFANGKNSIRLRLKGEKLDYIFSYYAWNNWKFETVDSFIKNISTDRKGVQKM